MRVLAWERKGEHLIPDRYEDLLEDETKAFAVVGTVGPGGEPQANPVWFGWDGEHLTFSQLTVRQKYRNLLRDRRIALCIVDPTNPYRYLEVRGRLDEIVPDPDFALIDRISEKYTGAPFANRSPDDERMLLKVRPIKTSGMG